MGPVAERLLTGRAATAERNAAAAAQVNGPALGIHDLKIPFDSKGTMVIDRDSAGHG